jgi:hypothetical protein
MTRNKIPVLYGRITKSGRQIRVWCPVCKRYHLHGIPGGLQESEHRVAHCIDRKSPYRETGYYLKLKL